MAVGKQTNGLMIHMRNNKNISISGSRQKKELLRIGYYHGYKGYRFIKKANHTIPYTDFEEILAVYNYDTNVKTIFYPLIMSIETALKNYTLDTLVSFGSVDLESAFRTMLNDHKSVAVSDKLYKPKMNDHLKLKKKIHSSISFKYSYPDGRVIQHFVNNKDSIPLWAIFEILDMGDFGLFLKCLNEPIRKKISSNLNIGHRSLNPQDGRLIQNIIFCLKELRNSVAHNNVIFDCRFTSTNVTNNVKDYVQLETRISNVDFNFLIDYFILMIVILKKTGKTKTELKRIIKDFEGEAETLKANVPVSIFHSIVGTNINTKLQSLEQYI